MTCTCTEPGFCPVLGKLQTKESVKLCQTRPDLQQIWLDNRKCMLRGPQIGERTQKIESKTCITCSGRGTIVPVFKCELHGSCTMSPWQFGQPEGVCRNCSDIIVPKNIDEAYRSPQ